MHNIRWRSGILYKQDMKLNNLTVEVPFYSTKIPVF